MLLTWSQNPLYAAVMSLFANGEPGFWLDPSDMSTMFTDSAGTTPVTAVEQPVGLILDKSKGLVLDSELVTNGNFEAWSGAAPDSWSIASTVTKSTSITHGGTNSAKFAPAAGVNPQLSQNFATVANAWYKVDMWVYGDGSAFTIAFATSNGGASVFYLNPTITVGAAGWREVTFYFCPTVSRSTFTITNNNNTSYTFYVDDISIKPLAGTHYYQSTAGVRPVLSARVNLLLATATLSTQSVTVTAGSYVLAFSGAGSIALSGVSSGTKTAGSNTITCTAGTLTLTVTGSVTLADLRPADQATGLIPLYQAVVTATNYDTASFPLYLSGNGTQWMQCAAQDYTGVNKIMLCGGVRKKSDAALAVVFELSPTIASNNGAVLLSAPNSAAANLNFSSKGTTQVDNVVTTYTSPNTTVLTGLGDISSPSNIVRVNGAQVGSVASTQGTGNYGNYAGFLFARNGAASMLTGNIYGLVARGSTAASSAAQIAAVEAYENQKTRSF